MDPDTYRRVHYNKHIQRIMLPRFSICEHRNWCEPQYLNETCHYFEKQSDGNYRLALKNIANDIAEQKYNDKVRLYSGSNNMYEYYEYNLPFASVRRMNIIDTLKIFVCTNVKVRNEQGIEVQPNTSMFNCYIITDESQYINMTTNYTPFNRELFPLYKADGNYINCITIVIESSQNLSYNTILTSISHELCHAVNLIGNTKYQNKIMNLNDQSEELFALLPDVSYKKDSVNISDRDIVSVAANCVYYCQDTEINAHIESCIAEAKAVKLSYDNFIELCRNHNNINKYSDTMITFDNYQIMFNFIKQLKLLSEVQLNVHDDIINKILDILYTKNRANKTFKQLIQYWHKQLEKFFNNLSNCVYNNYPDIL